MSLTIASVIAFACASQDNSRALPELPADAVPVAVHATFVTRPLVSTTINGAALYHGSDGADWVIATTTNNAVVVLDAATGDSIRTVGARGTGMGELHGPTGIVVLGDSIALVVERDNGRVQGFHLPDFTSVGTFGDQLIGKPSAITAYLAGNAYAVYVAYNTDAEFARVAQFRLTVGKGELIAIHWRTFGDTAGKGVIHSSDAIAVDAERDRLLISDRVSGESAIRVYDINGHFAGRVIASGVAHAAGVGLYACSDKGGYWLTTERRDSEITFQILDRESLARVGAFALLAGQMDRMLAVSPHAYATFLAGVVFAERDDGSLSAIAWRDVAAALQFRPDCNHG